MPTSYAYDPNDKHAASQMGSASYGYDANGNMTSRGGDVMQYDVENRLITATVGITTTGYLYNGDRSRAKRVVNGAATYYVGNVFEVTVNGGITTTSGAGQGD
jgi:hypothetical protein